MQKLIGFLLLTLFINCKTTKPIIEAHYPRLDESEAVIVVVDMKHVFRDNHLGKLRPSGYLWFYENDVVDENEKSKITSIHLRDVKNTYQYEPIFLEVEKKARSLGGNYVNIRKIIQQYENDNMHNIIEMDVYRIEGAESYRMYQNWNKDFVIDKSHSIKRNDSEEQMETCFRCFPLGLSSPNSKTIDFYFLNQIVYQGCNYTTFSSIDLLRENVKFDMIEWCQRKKVKTLSKKGGFVHKSIFEMQEIYDNLILEIEKWTAKIDAITDRDELIKLDKEINQKIDSLDKYKEKRLSF